MTDWKMITIPKEVHAKIMILKGILELKSMGAVIKSLMLSRGYTEEFFERIREEVIE